MNALYLALFLISVLVSSCLAHESVLALGSEGELIFSYRPETAYSKTFVLPQTKYIQRFPFQLVERTVCFWAFSFSLHRPPVASLSLERLQTAFFWDQEAGLWKAIRSDGKVWYLHFRTGGTLAFTSPGNLWFHLHSNAEIRYEPLNANRAPLCFDAALFSLYAPGLGHIAFDRADRQVTGFSFVQRYDSTRLDLGQDDDIVLSWQNPELHLALPSTQFYITGTHNPQPPMHLEADTDSSYDATHPDSEQGDTYGLYGTSTRSKSFYYPSNL
jgi:hypothetical protein